MKKQKNVHLFALVAVVFLMLSSCSNDENVFNFKNPQEAVNACSEELYELRSIREADIKELAKMSARWIALQDSTFSIMTRDSTIDMDSPITDRFFNVADSIRIELSRLVFAQERSIEDVVYFKINTAKDKNKIRNSNEYKLSKDFFNQLDKNKCYSTLEQTLSEYHKLIDNPVEMKKEKDLLNFIKKEDVCFRSLMNFLYQIPQEELQTFAHKTSAIIESLYKRSCIDDGNNRIMLYLSMRVNRRIIQNALAVKRDMDNGLQLNDIQISNYRWMAIQPFISIDNYSMSTLTEEQEEQLKSIAACLPKMLADIEGKDYNKATKDKIQNMTDVLTEYFLKSYLRQVL